MPALPPVPNVVKVVLEGTNGGHNWANVMHAQWTGASPSNATLNTIAGDISASWGTNMKSLTTASCELTGVVVTDLTSNLGAQGSNPTVIAGTRTGGNIGGNAAVLVNFPSSFRYRGGHPRIYLVPGSDTDLASSSAWSSTFQGLVETGFAALQSTIATATTGGFSMAGQCAVSYYSVAITPAPPHRRVTPLVMPIATGSFTVELELASQRRRIGRK